MTGETAPGRTTPNPRPSPRRLPPTRDSRSRDKPSTHPRSRSHGARELRRSSRLVIGDHDRKGRLTNAVDPDPFEHTRGPCVERRCEHSPFCLDVRPERLTKVPAFDADEVPRLGETNARRGVSCSQDPPNNLLIDGSASELAPDVPSLFDDVIQACFEGVRTHGQTPAVRRPTVEVATGPSGLARRRERRAVWRDPCRTLTGFPILPEGHLAVAVQP